MSYEIRVLNESELNLANQLYSKVYGKERSLNDFKWEFLEGPIGKAIYVGAFDGARLIGTQAAIPLFFVNKRGDKILTAKSEDTLLDPEYRGKGLFDKMYEVLFQECKKVGIVSVWGFTYAKKPFLKLGFEIPFETNNAVMVFNPFGSYKYLVSLNPLNKLKEKIKIFGFVMLSYFKSKFSTRNSTSDFKVLVSSVVDSLLNLQIHVLASCESQSLIMDADYLKWRIINNPYNNKYMEAGMFNQIDQKIASVIYNLRPQGVAYIEQILISCELKNKDRAALIFKVLSELKRMGAHTVRFWGMQGSKVNIEEIEILKHCGFVFSGRGTAFVYKRLGEEAVGSDNLLVSRLFTQGNL